jgi:hypothetical protein
VKLWNTGCGLPEDASDEEAGRPLTSELEGGGGWGYPAEETNHRSDLGE